MFPTCRRNAGHCGIGPVRSGRASGSIGTDVHEHVAARLSGQGHARQRAGYRSEEHTSELQSLMRISYAVFCLKKKKNNKNISAYTQHKYKITKVMLITNGKQY